MRITFWDMNKKIPIQYNYIYDSNEVRLDEILTCIDKQYKQIKESAK